MEIRENPPRNGEGDQVKLGGGALAASRPNVERARRRRQQMTLPEVLLWRALRGRPGGFKFRRQHPVGGYVVDFACLSERLIIEVDGDVHSNDKVVVVDRLRQADLEARGFKFLRVAARDVFGNLDGVVAVITAHRRTPLHQPSAGPPPRSGEDV